MSSSIQWCRRELVSLKKCQETSKTEMQRERKEKRKKRKGKDRIEYSGPVRQLQMCSIHVMGNTKYI